MTQAPSKASLVTSSIHRLCGGTCPYRTVLLQDVKRVCYTHKICNNFIVKVFSRPHTLHTLDFGDQPYVKRWYPGHRPRSCFHCEVTFVPGT